MATIITFTPIVALTNADTGATIPKGWGERNMIVGEDIRLSLGILKDIRLKKTRALFLYLLTTAGQRLRSERLMDLLWQNADDKKAAASLRQAIRQIRVAATQWPALTITTGAGIVYFDVPGRWSIQDDLIKYLKSSQWQPQDTEGINSFLAQLDALFGISESFDSWITITRNTVVSHLHQALDDAIDGQPDPAIAARAAEFALDIEPANETALRVLMQFYWEHNKATRALALYDRTYAYLDTHFDQEPEPATADLVAQIKLDPTGGTSQHPIHQGSEKVTIAVKMTDTHLDRQHASLLGVLGADFNARLSRFREWSVVENAPDALIAIRLNLAAFDGHPVFSVEARRAADGEILWSEAIEEPTTQWDRKIRQVLSRIATALSIVVRDPASNSVAANGYDKWLQSQTLLDQWTPQNENRAIALLHEVSQSNPQFAPAHAELAGALNVRHVLRPGTHQTEDIKQIALFHALEAISIDPLDTRAHRVLAWCYCHKREFELAEFHFDQALRLNPENILTLSSCALGFGFTHALDRSASLVRDIQRRSQDIDTFHMIYLAAAEYLAGRYEQAADLCAQGQGAMSTVGGWHAASLLKIGRKAEATERFATWQTEIRRDWHDTTQSTTDNVIAWFASVFPLRDDAVREDLRFTLTQVALTVD